jgi:predicted dehydrogenase
MIAGLGNAGMDHARALESIPDATVIAGIDIDSTRSLLFRDGPVPVYLDASAAYNARLDPDVIVIAAPTGVHDQVCADAAKYFPQAVLLVEKPAADRLPEALSIINNTGKNRRVDVAYHMAYSPEVTWAVERTREMADELGLPVSIQAWAADPYQIDHASATARFGSSWIDSGINALSVIERFATLVERTSYRTIGQEPLSASEGRFICSYRGSRFPATVLTSWQSSGPTRSTRITYSSGSEVVMDHHGVVGYIIRDGSTVAFYGGDATVPRRENHYRELYRSWLVGDEQMFSAETSARLHSLLLSD